jgi:hypothetical protein
MSQPELLKSVATALEAAGAPYMLTGSYASSLQGEPRLTHDIDLVVVLDQSSIRFLVQAFPAPDFYLDEHSIIAAMSNQSQFNLLQVNTGDKVDFWMLTDDPFDQSRFARRRTVQFRGQRLFVSSPEDTILMKLRWAEMSGGSEKQLGDARSVYELQRESLDLSYLEHWAQVLNVVELLERIQGESPKS